GIDVLGGQAAQNLPLRQQGLPLGVRHGGRGVCAGVRTVLDGGPVLGQQGVDPRSGLLMLPRRLEAGYIVGQAGVQAAEPFILISSHGYRSPFISLLCVTSSQQATASYSHPAASVPVPTLLR